MAAPLPLPSQWTSTEDYDYKVVKERCFGRWKEEHLAEMSISTRQDEVLEGKVAPPSTSEMLKAANDRLLTESFNLARERRDFFDWLRLPINGGIQPPHPSPLPTETGSINVSWVRVDDGEKGLVGTRYYCGASGGSAVWLARPKQQGARAWDMRWTYCGRVPRPSEEYAERLRVILARVLCNCLAVRSWGHVDWTNERQVARYFSGLDKLELFVRRGLYGFVRAMWEKRFAGATFSPAMASNCARDPWVAEVVYLVSELRADAYCLAVDDELKALVQIATHCTGLGEQELCSRHREKQAKEARDRFNDCRDKGVVLDNVLVIVSYSGAKLVSQVLVLRSSLFTTHPYPTPYSEACR